MTRARSASKVIGESLIDKMGIKCLQEFPQGNFVTFVAMVNHGLTSLEKNTQAIFNGLVSGVTYAVAADKIYQRNPKKHVCQMGSGACPYWNRGFIQSHCR